MPLTLHPDLRGLLRKAIGDTFDFDQLDDLLSRCYDGSREINEIASARDASRVVAERCLDKTERDGTLDLFLLRIVEHPAAGAPLRQLVERAAPDILAGRSLRRAAPIPWPAGAPAGLLQLRQAREPVRDSLAAIECFSANLEKLETYKHLHDFLHQLQVRNYADLNLAVRSMEGTAPQLTRLREFQEQVRNAVAQARPSAQRLPDADAARATELGWIGIMETAAQQFGHALLQRNFAMAGLALGSIWSIVENEPPRLNRLIFALAGGLQLDHLSMSLRRMKQFTPDTGQIEQVFASLNGMRTTLVAKAVDHAQWQDVDSNLADLDKVFELRTDDPTTDFVRSWPQASSLARRLSRTDVSDAGPESVGAYADMVDEELLRIAAGASDHAAPSAMPAQSRLYDYYDAFRRQARFRFLQIDTSLKHDCAALARLAAPLHALLKDLADG